MKAIIPASTRSTGTRVTACCRRGPRQSKTTSSFLNIVDVFSLTETHLEQKCFRGASTYRLRNCWRLGKAQGWPYSSQKPSSPSAELCSWNLFYNCDYLLSQWASCKEFPKQWVFLSSVVSLETPVLLSCSTDSHWAQFKLQYKSHGIHSMMGKVHVIRGLMQVTVTPCQIRDWFRVRNWNQCCQKLNDQALWGMKCHELWDTWGDMEI